MKTGKNIRQRSGECIQSSLITVERQDGNSKKTSKREVLAGGCSNQSKAAGSIGGQIHIGLSHAETQTNGVK